ncbi:hypothetical protein HaLaN_15493 [Haematococcus lacustris]|uniref:Uncharacterized protein n=1 Tax=Haematococcus lacustris TaxID=44745 RepID=A0A699Z7Q7_HAELA|nr:hypothetical protein HaLaN_15493 [Haematococcus lacustris]
MLEAGVLFSAYHYSHPPLIISVKQQRSFFKHVLQ